MDHIKNTYNTKRNNELSNTIIYALRFNNILLNLFFFYIYILVFFLII